MVQEAPAGTATWLAGGEHDLPSGGAWLTSDEATRASGMPFTKRRTEYLLRRWVCKAAVAAVVGLPDDPLSLARIGVTNRPGGVPTVLVDGVETGLDVSLSDRAGWAVCLVGESVGRVGCDLEIVEPRSPRFMADFLTAAEQEYVAAQTAAERDVASNVIWSAKESALKVLQTGLRRDTRSIERRHRRAGRIDRLVQARPPRGRGERAAGMVAPRRFLPGHGGRRRAVPGAPAACGVRRPGGGPASAQLDGSSAGRVSRATLVSRPCGRARVRPLR